MIDVDRLRGCFEGAIPAVLATASADGVPNVTYLSRVCVVDRERIALSNQFFSKTSRNLAANPRGSLMMVDPATWHEYRLTIVYERTDRRGPVFDRLRQDVDLVAALEGMQDVFKLRAADIYRVLEIEELPGRPLNDEPLPASGAVDSAALGELGARLSRAADLDAIVATAVDGLAELFGYEHSLLLLLDEGGSKLYTIASHGYDEQGVGSEVPVGEGVVGVAAARCRSIVVGNMGQLTKYSRRVRQSFEDAGVMEPGDEIPVPRLPEAHSRVAVPAMAMGQLVGVLTVEHPDFVAFGPSDEAVLTMVASLVGSAIELERARERATDAAQVAAAPIAVDRSKPPVHVRFFAVDGSTFIDGDYLIKGVAGRILWALLGHHEREGRSEFTNREIRLDPTLELPEFRDNFESRLILLKRRLDERAAPIRIEKSGRGRFRLIVDAPLRLDGSL